MCEWVLFAYGKREKRNQEKRYKIYNKSDVVMGIFIIHGIKNLIPSPNQTPWALGEWKEVRRKSN